MTKPKHNVSLRRKSDSALFKGRKFRGNILMKIHEEKTSNTYIQSNSNANSSAPLPFAKSLVDFTSSSDKKLKHIAKQE